MDELRKHTLVNFEEALTGLCKDVLTMAGLTERNLSAAMKGLFERNDELCNRVIADDEALDQFEKQIDKDGVIILLRFQPVASDLRQVISAMKVSNNLERVADQAVNIARKARKLNQQQTLPEMSLLRGIFDQASAMLADSIKAYTEGNVPLAVGLKPRDKHLDALNAEIASSLTKTMTQNPLQISGYLNLMFISRHLERVGDHATNIAEDAVYAAAAEDIRHTMTN